MIILVLVGDGKCTYYMNMKETAIQPVVMHKKRRVHPCHTGGYGPEFYMAMGGVLV